MHRSFVIATHSRMAGRPRITSPKFPSSQSCPESCNLPLLCLSHRYLHHFCGCHICLLSKWSVVRLISGWDHHSKSARNVRFSFSPLFSAAAATPSTRRFLSPSVVVRLAKRPILGSVLREGGDRTSVRAAKVCAPLAHPDFPLWLIDIRNGFPCTWQR